MSDLVTTINTLAFQFMKSIANPTFNTFMAFIATDSIVVLVIAVIGLYLFYRKDKNVFTFVVAGALVYAVAYALKLIVHEPRPCTVSSLSWINRVGCDSSTFSFPSEHASVLTGLYFFVDAYKYLRVLYIIWLVLILFGRVYLGAHYLTDVVAGMVLSIALMWAVRVYRKQINAFLAGIAKAILPQLFDVKWQKE